MIIVILIAAWFYAVGLVQMYFAYALWEPMTWRDWVFVLAWPVSVPAAMVMSMIEK